MSKDKGMLIILSGPSGSGKDTILDELNECDPDIQLSISLTTRPARSWEIDGFHYYFVSEESFLSSVEDNKVLEYARYGRHYYGTPKGPVDKWIEEGKNVILKIDVQGAEKIRDIYPDVVSIFLMPPSMQVLEERLRSRESECEKDIQCRMNCSWHEMEQACYYDYVVVNDVVKDAVQDIYAIIKAEKLKYKRMEKMISEVMQNG